MKLLIRRGSTGLDGVKADIIRVLAKVHGRGFAMRPTKRVPFSTLVWDHPRELNVMEHQVTP